MENRIGYLTDGTPDPCYDCRNIDKECQSCGEGHDYDKYKGGNMRFATPYDQYHERNDQECQIVRELTDAERDPEVGTMYLIRFADGGEIHAWPEELITEERCKRQ